MYNSEADPSDLAQDVTLNGSASIDRNFSKKCVIFDGQEMDQPFQIIIHFAVTFRD
jgi:hypothetical protein